LDSTICARSSIINANETPHLGFDGTYVDPKRQR
jgi:hypothetical protein